MLKLQRFALAASVAVPLGMLTSPAGAANLIETMQQASKSGQFEVDQFATAIEAAGLADMLEGSGPYTIFAPTDEAFDMLQLGKLKPQGAAKTPKEQLQSADKDQLAELVKHYIAKGKMSSVELIKKEKVDTLEGGPLAVSAAKGGVLVDDIEVLKPDIMADNGVIHVIGGLFKPDTAGQTGTERQK